MLTFDELERRLNIGLGEDENLEFKSNLFENQTGINNPILKSVVALANASGGNLVIGVEQKKGKWNIFGTPQNEDYVRNWLSQLVYEYVEPEGLPFKVYPIISNIKNLKCIIIEVGKSRGRYFAVRYSGRRSGKNPSYYFPLRIGDSSRLVDFHSFVQSIFSNWLTGLSAVAEKGILPSYTSTEGRKFDLEKFKMRLDELKSIKKMNEPETERTIFDELRNSLTDLLPDSTEQWTNELRKAILELTSLLLVEFKTDNEDSKKRVMDMLDIIVHRADKETIEKIKNDFLELFEKIYDDPNSKKSSDLIGTLQVLHNYEPDYIKKMIIDSVESWSKEDFETRHHDIEIDKYLWKDGNRLKELRSFILESLANERKAKNMDKVKRLGMLYDKIRSR